MRYLSGLEAASAVEDCFSSDLSSVAAHSVALSELEEEEEEAEAVAVVLGAEVAGEGCVADGAVLGWEGI